MISAVLDTNILAAGTVSSFNPPGQILDAWRAGQFELVTSEYILGELKQTFQKPYFQKRVNIHQINAFIDLLYNEAFVTPITVDIRGAATHPEDDFILATAVSAQANYLVTGDDRLLRKVGTSYQGVNLTTPNGFNQILKRRS